MRTRLIKAVELPAINEVDDWDTAHCFITKTDIEFGHLAQSYLNAEYDFAMRLKTVISSNNLNDSDFVFKKMFVFPESDIPTLREKEKFLVKQIAGFGIDTDAWISNALSKKDDLVLLFKLSLRLIIHFEICSKKIRLVPATDGFSYVAYTPNDFPLENYFADGQYKYEISDMI